MSDSVVIFPASPAPRHSPSEETDIARSKRLGALEAIIFAAETPPTLDQLATALELSVEVVRKDLVTLRRSYHGEDRGVEVRAVGGGFRMSTKAEHHEAVMAFAKSVKPRLRLSSAALETLAIVAYRQPVTIPEIGAIRGVSAPGGVIHTLLGHKLITTAGRKKVIGRPMRYKTTKQFLLQFGLNDLSDLPTTKEMEELSLAALTEDSETASGSMAESSRNGPGPDSSAEPSRGPEE